MRIGGYEIVALLGAGGMGEVYRARDARLGRDVAIKILSPNIAADADALMRFEREARALASLNHPNIAAIYGVEDTNGQPALILELVDGETLADRIATGPIAVSDAIEFAKQIADALDVAHEAGIVHRDLKPGNIKITGDGRVKVLDFGLAKAIAAAAGQAADVDPANSPTITVHGTKQDVILGTAAYMSPEQARGKRIDKRTDIWAFGCVVFEMLTARRAFSGETTSDVIAAIIERTPDLNLLPRTTPGPVRRVIVRCLEKDPKRRARDIADVRADLDSPIQAAATGASRRSRAALLSAAAIALVAIGVALTSWRGRVSPSSPPPPIEFTFGAPPGYSLVATPSVPSPDSRHIAFVARDAKQIPSIFVRSLETGTVRAVEGTAGGAIVPVWSPDGRSLAFFLNNSWKRISLDGGPPVTIAANVQANLGASWGPGDVLLMSPANRTSLSRVSTTGGELQPVTTLDADTENSHRWPQLLPDGRHFLFTVRSDQPERLGIKIGALGSRDARLLVNVASPGMYAEPGWLLFTTPDAVLMAQRLDPATWTLQDAAQPIAGPVSYNGPSFLGMFSSSLDGRVVTYLSPPRAGRMLEWFDRTGKPLGSLGPERAYEGLRLSRDGRMAAVELADEHLGTRDLWLMDIATGSLTRFTSHPATDWRAVFSPDGKSIAFASDRAGRSTVLSSATTGGAQSTVLRSPEGGVFPEDWFSDGRHLLVSEDDRSGRPSTLMRVPAAGGDPVTLIHSDTLRLTSPRLSPDDTRIAFMSREGSSALEVFLWSIRDQQRVRVSTEGGSNPVWGKDGNELFFVSPSGNIMRAALDGIRVTSPPRPMFRPCVGASRAYSVTPLQVSYDVSADGKRFLVICNPADSVPTAINVIVNWQSKLK